MAPTAGLSKLICPSMAGLRCKTNANLSCSGRHLTTAALLPRFSSAAAHISVSKDNAAKIGAASRDRSRQTARPINYQSPVETRGQLRLMSSTPTSWKAPTNADLDNRPVLIIGAGNLGSRIAVMWASARRPVVVYDSSSAALDAALPYISDTLAKVCAEEERHPGHVSFVSTMSKATVALPWMAIEALPEKLDLKRSVLGKLEPLLPDDCIIATNSSSYRSQEMVGVGGVTKPARFLNTHYYVPPRNRFVELMTSGATDDAVFPFLAQQMKTVGLKPLVLPSHVQSPGFIFNRIWAATKRETLSVLSEGIANPADIDALFRDFFHSEKGPCEKMDEVGLDAVLRVESHSLREQPELNSQAQLDWLKKEYIDKNRLGEKTGDGLFTAKERESLELGNSGEESNGA